jgi:hypothetical protein
MINQGTMTHLYPIFIGVCLVAIAGCKGRDTFWNYDHGITVIARVSGEFSQFNYEGTGKSPPLIQYGSEKIMIGVPGDFENLCKLTAVTTRDEGDGTITVYRDSDQFSFKNKKLVWASVIANVNVKSSLQMPGGNRFLEFPAKPSEVEAVFGKPKRKHSARTVVP